MARNKTDVDRDEIERDDPDTAIASAPSDVELGRQAPSDADVRTPPRLRPKDFAVAFKRAFQQFGKDQVTDIAAGLTYFAVLALFPAILAIVSLLSLINQGDNVTEQLLAIFSSIAPANTVEALEGPIEDLTATPAAGIGFVVGLVGAIWSASGYVGAFSRGMNRIYAVQEGRTYLKFQPLILLVTVIALVMLAAMALLLVLTGDLAEVVGNLIGIGDEVVFVWNIVKWPVLAVLAMLIIAMLYYATPNVKQHKFRWLTIGSVTALVSWAVATFGFFFYVSNFGNFGRVYGTLGGIIVFLLWLYISNMAILYGAEVDSEIERVRELRTGIKAEYAVQLPLRSMVKIDKAIDAEAKAVLEAKQIRQEG